MTCPHPAAEYALHTVRRAGDEVRLVADLDDSRYSADPTAMPFRAGVEARFAGHDVGVVFLLVPKSSGS